MADAGKNSLWSDISSGGDVQTDILGPSYSYADHIPGPSSLGVGSDGTFSQLGNNASAIGTYVKTLISGDPPLGNQYFVNTGGTCTASDNSIQSRYNYISNLASGSELVPAAMSELGTDFNGLIPGIFGDIEGLNPLYMFKALSSDSSPPCECYKCDVSSGSPYQFLTTSLSPDFDSTYCTKVDNSMCAQTPPESFTNNSTHSGIPVLIACVLFAFVFSAKCFK